MNALVRKLETLAPLSEGDRGAVTEAASTTRVAATREDLIREGEPHRAVNLLLTGFACRYRTLADGRRQMLAFFVPGDFCDPLNFVLERMDYSVATLTEARVAALTPETVDALTAHGPQLRRALWCSQLVDEAITREWVVNLGQRTALERTAHLFCELFWRLRAVGLTRGDACELPFTQTELADALGLSAVHVNRTLQELRRTGLITLSDGELVIPDLPALEALALFTPAYLHLQAGAQTSGKAPAKMPQASFT